MPNKTILTSRLSLLLITLILSLKISAAENCKVQWGPAKMGSNENCQINQKATSEPSSIILKGFNWKYRQKSLALKIKVANIHLMSGLKLSFYDRGQLKATYTLPLYTDPEYNLLTEGQETILSIPVSSLKWEGNASQTLNTDAQFNTLSIYLATDKEGQQTLSLNILKTLYLDRPAKGKISITFDDGYQSNLTAASIMAPLKLAGTAYIIPKAIDKKGHLSSKDLSQIKKWGWSISAHLTTPVTQIKNLPQVLKETKAQIMQRGNSASAEHFALPLGKYDAETLEILKKYFKSVRLAGGHAETLPVQDHYRLKTINVTQAMPPEEVFEWCKKSILNKEWAILMFHYLDQPEKGELNYSSKNYKKLMNLLKPYAQYVKTVEQVLSQ